MRGHNEYLVKSARQNPKAFAKVETALEELRGFGLRNAEIDFTRWNREQVTIT